MNLTDGLTEELREELEELLNEIFLRNATVLEQASDYHATVKSDATYDYEAPILTKYGRLTHNQDNVPEIEIAFALLHYETALHQFDALKKAANEQNTSREFLHGVSCTISMAACLEAIANKLAHTATGAHPTYKDKRTPLKKINESAQTVSAHTGGSYTALLESDSAFARLDKLRERRNSFIHAKEVGDEVDSSSQKSSIVSSVSEEECRQTLRELRLTVKRIFESLPNLPAPIETRENVKWLGELEVP